MTYTKVNQYKDNDSGYYVTEIDLDGGSSAAPWNDAQIKNEISNNLIPQFLIDEGHSSATVATWPAGVVYYVRLVGAFQRMKVWLLSLN